MGCEISQPPAPSSKSFDQVDWTANVPVASERLAAAPCPKEIHAHLSAFSSPNRSIHPLLGNWSVTVSEYSCPLTIEIPSSAPATPAFTKFAPHVGPTSGT